MLSFPKRLIEVDLPIKKISEHARREKSIRHGHISTLHIWWARRPLAACRAVICAALWPDPGDTNCPERFKTEASRIMREFRDKRGGKPYEWDDGIELRKALLDFIADFANWDNSTNKDFLETSRALTQVAHESLGGEPGTRPLVVDPFAGGGAIPLEALRVGADAFASDLNPVAVLLNKVVLEYIPKYGQKLADEVRKWGEWIKREAEKELAEFYPKDSDGATPIAYLWARTVICEGPGCGAEIPLMRSLGLAKKGKNSVAIKIIPNIKNKRPDFEIIENVKDTEIGKGTIQRGSATCPLCGYTTQVKSIRSQLKTRNGGARDARLFAVAIKRPNKQGVFYRIPNERDFVVLKKAEDALEKLIKNIPGENLPLDGALGFRVQKYGITFWHQLFTARQLLSVITYSAIIANIIRNNISKEKGIPILAFSIGKIAQNLSSITRWRSDVERIEGAFGMQTVQMVWDFGEASPLLEEFPVSHTNLVSKIIDHIRVSYNNSGTTEQGDASASLLPDDCCSMFFTDPPYYDAISYADLSDFFYVWLKRSLGGTVPALFDANVTPKDLQAIMNPLDLDENGKQKDAHYYERKMKMAFEQGRRELSPIGIGTIVFAHKSTLGWEKLIDAVIQSGWIITASWPIDTEMTSRMRAMNSATLSSSIHLVCRPRENPDGSLRTDDIGDWRDVLAELPKRIHEWMPRLAEEGVVGADAIFACLGPALEIFSRYSRVEKASGEVVPLKEYLEHVWAAVAKEALTMIFEGAETTGFEEDARLTAMWLWTLSTGTTSGNGDSSEEEETASEEEDEEKSSSKSKLSGYTLEYDAARKIAQGLGAHLEKLQSLVEVRGDKARLLPVAERTRALFGKDEATAPRAKKKKKEQLSMFAEIEEAEESGTWGAKNVPQLGNTTLDRLHQAMILFAAGRGEALKRFLVEEGVGRDERFWRLAQAFSALYPKNTDEKRWVDGVLARKKGLGL